VSDSTAANCGACGQACTGTNKTCINGQCVCTNTCAAPRILNPTTCVCECPGTSPFYCAISNSCIACPAPKVLNPNSCACECPATTCAAPKTLNASTCACQCPACPAGQSLVDPDTCRCTCATNESICNGTCSACPASYVPYPLEQCACSCPPNTGAIACPGTAFGSACCPTSHVCENGACAACPAGTVRTGCRTSTGSSTASVRCCTANQTCLYDTSTRTTSCVG
jgi:hypothetical protein